MNWYIEIPSYHGWVLSINSFLLLPLLQHKSVSFEVKYFGNGEERVGPVVLMSLQEYWPKSGSMFTIYSLMLYGTAIEYLGQTSNFVSVGAKMPLTPMTWILLWRPNDRITLNRGHFCKSNKWILPVDFGTYLVDISTICIKLLCNMGIATNNIRQ